MRSSILATAIVLAIGSSVSFAAVAQSSSADRDRELADLKAQLQAMQAQLTELETRTDAQSDINLDNAGVLDKLTTGATKVETKGGMKLTSADGKFEASLGGRIHFDAYAFDRDLANTTGTTEFRRARLTLQRAPAIGGVPSLRLERRRIHHPFTLGIENRDVGR